MKKDWIFDGRMDGYMIKRIPDRCNIYYLYDERIDEMKTICLYTPEVLK